MSQEILTQEWVETFVSTWNDKESGLELALSLQHHVRHAMAVLDTAPLGELVVFEGQCPSGTTYEASFRWDGSPEMREAIARKARELGRQDAHAAWLVLVTPAVRRGVIAAEMRTG